jgi:hypothetical protein
MQVLPERTFSSEEKQQALDLVLHSQTFARADRLRQFLRYICDMEAAGRAEQITEYSIATEALGRPASYSPTADSGVRGRAHDLRQKLEQLYQLELPHATVRIGLRKGSYSPFYYEVARPEMESIMVLAPPAPSPTVRKGLAERHLLEFILLAVIAGLAMKIFLFTPSRPDGIFEEFWGPLLRPGSDVLLCLATPPSLLIKPYRDPPRRDVFRPILPDSPWYSRVKLHDGGGQPYMYYSGDTPLFGDAESVAFAAQVITAGGGSFDILPENTLRPAALRNRNVVLVGSSNYSAYAARILKNTPFYIREDSGLGEEIIEERAEAGKRGRTFVPRRDDAGQLAVVYGLVTVFPNQTQSGQDSRTIMISGVTGAGASAAAHFFTSKTGLLALRERIHRSGAPRVPASYQLVIKSSKDQAVALTWELAAYRMMQHSPNFE